MSILPTEVDVFLIEGVLNVVITIEAYGTVVLDLFAVMLRHSYLLGLFSF